MLDDQGTIVVVEDDPHIADLLDMYLRRAGFRVLLAGDAGYGLELVEREDPRLVVLDIGLPGDLDGLDLCRRIRASREVPIVILTARDDEIDRVIGLELGADDYIGKPFSPRELVARVKAILRRAGGSAATGFTAGAANEVLVVGEVQVDRGRREVRSGEDSVELTAREFDLLAHFAANPGLVYTRSQLIHAVWGIDWYGDERTVDVHVGQLRKKLGGALPLRTVWGVGYRCG